MIRLIIILFFVYHILILKFHYHNLNDGTFLFETTIHALWEVYIMIVIFSFYCPNFALCSTNFGAYYFFIDLHIIWFWSIIYIFRWLTFNIETITTYLLSICLYNVFLFFVHLLPTQISFIEKIKCNWIIFSFLHIRDMQYNESIIQYVI